MELEEAKIIYKAAKKHYKKAKQQVEDGEIHEMMDRFNRNTTMLNDLRQRPMSEVLLKFNTLDEEKIKMLEEFCEHYDGFLVSWTINS